MVTEQPEALRLAQHINDLFVSQWGMNSPTARDSKIVLDELRRLHEVNQELLAALESVWLWMENQADGQSKGGHATFDLMMLREQRDIAHAAINKAERTTT